jgi:23S rRNA pseudouridine1911/1915/1917 synthase
MVDIKIIYEDADVVAINKPAGVRTHPDAHGSGETIADWFLNNYPNSSEVGEPLTLPDGQVISRPGIVHRLDKDTSGIMILAKHQEAYLFLKEQFQARDLSKTYRALVYGVLKAPSGTIEVPIGRSRKDPRVRVAHEGAVGVLRPAVTEYAVLEQFRGHALVEARPKTGRTHQIRVHFKSIGHPIVCDSLYAPKEPCLPGLDRQALHAYSLELTLPSGTGAKLEAELPADFQAALDKLRVV